METQRWTVLDRSTWGPGPWDTEPDKVQWPDPTTGLPCLAVRSRLGNWCGYVGVPATHPWHGKGYNQCTGVCGGTEDSYCGCAPESVIEVHGGLTFADGCTPHTSDDWERWRTRLHAGEEEARQHTQGDAAVALREAGAALNDYDAFVAYAESRFICHLPAPGEPDNIHWFGFDCAHSGDLAPGMRAYLPSRGYRDTYRDLTYVQEETARLAAQLAAQGEPR